MPFLTIILSLPDLIDLSSLIACMELNSIINYENLYLLLDILMEFWVFIYSIISLFGNSDHKSVE